MRQRRMEEVKENLLVERRRRRHTHCCLICLIRCNIYSTTMFLEGCSRLMPFTGGPSWLCIVLSCAATLLSTELKCAVGMQVMPTGSQTILKAEGEGVTLGCRYTPSPFDTGELDIEWSVINPDTTQKDQMLISYTGGSKYVHGNPALTKGLGFTANDPSTGDASLSIALLSPAQSATYQCKVKKSPGVDTLKVSLVVMAKPSAPKCWLEGADRVGASVSLRCKSEGGSGPLAYSWKRERPGPIPATAVQNSVTGELTISNHSQSSAGIYLCEVNNAVGAERCRIILKANKPPNRVGVITGTAVGSLLLVFILLVFIAILSWKLRSRRCYEKEFSNEIREDAAPPESRPVSRHTGRSANRHPPAAYTLLGGIEANSSRDESTDTPSTNSRGRAAVKPTPVDYDGKYGHERAELFQEV